jgi:hypothetical protein
LWIFLLNLLPLSSLFITAACRVIAIHIELLLLLLLMLPLCRNDEDEISQTINEENKKKRAESEAANYRQSGGEHQVTVGRSFLN